MQALHTRGRARPKIVRHKALHAHRLRRVGDLALDLNARRVDDRDDGVSAGEDVL